MKTTITRLFALCALALCLFVPMQGHAQSVNGNITVLLPNQYQLSFTTNGIIANNVVAGQLYLNSGLFSCAASYTSIQTMVTSKGVSYATGVANGTYMAAGGIQTPCVITARFMTMRNISLLGAAGSGVGTHTTGTTTGSAQSMFIQNSSTGTVNFVITNANTNAIIYSSGNVSIIQGSLSIQQ